MARVLTQKDAYTLINSLVKQATGQTTLTATDVSSFISVGETLLSTGYENVLGSLSLILGRTLVASRDYKARFAILNALNTGAYTHRMRKVSFYSKDALPSGAWNTDIKTNFDDGYTSGDNGGNSTKSQWEQNWKHCLEVQFGGSSVWQYCITRSRDALKQAFRGPEEFNSFIAGMLTECANDIESEIEAFNRMTFVSEVAKRYYLEANNITSGCAINLTTGFNTKFNTNYSTQDLQTTYLKEFLAYMVSVIKATSDRMTERSTAFHDPFTNADGEVILRHTPYDRQRIMLYGPLLRDAESMVLPEIFRPEYLDIDRQFEKVEFWQSNFSETVRPQINIESAYLDHLTGEQKTTGAVNLKYLVGAIWDEDAIMTDFQLETTDATPLEARKKYFNVWYDFAKNAITDQTENMTIFYMAD